MKHRSGMRTVQLIFFLFLLLASCDESLPPRQDPARVLEIVFTRVNPWTLEPIDEETVFLDPGKPPNGLTFGFRVVNVYDDPLESKRYLVARYTVTPEARPDLAFTHTVVDTLGQTPLRLIPGKPVWFTWKWDLTLPAQPQPMPFWQILGNRPGWDYPFVISGSIRIFRELKEESPAAYAFSFRIP